MNAAKRTSFAPQVVLGGMLLGASFCLVLVLSLRQMADTDLWGHLACGKYFLDTGHILKTHFFNCSWPEFPYVNHSWLFQTVVAVVERAAGEPGLITLQVGLVFGAFLLLYRIVHLETKQLPIIAFVLALGALASMHRFSLRPQHFSFLFLLSYLYALRRYQDGAVRLVWLLPVIMIVWVNMHAESLWGILILGAFLAVEAVSYWRGTERSAPAFKRLLLLFGVVLAAAMINPFTYKTVFWPFFVMKEQFAGVEEILPPNTLKFLYFWIYCGLVVVTTVFNIRKANPFWIVLSVLFLVVAWTANRGIPHFVFVSAPLLGGNLSALSQSMSDRVPFLTRAGRVVPVVLAVLLVALIVNIVTSPLYWQKFDNIPYPDGAIKFLKENRIKANVFNEHMWGGYIIWTSYPDLRPYIDGRFFHKRFYAEYYPVMSGQAGWDRVLERYGVTAAILRYSPNRNPTLNDRLFEHPDWRLVYWDDQALVYLKRTEAHRAATDLYGNDLFNIDRDPYNTFMDRPRAFVLKANDLAERNAAFALSSAKAAIAAGNTWFALGDYSKALERYSQALRHMPAPNPGLLYHMALSYRYLGDLASTEDYLVRVLQVAPEAEQVRSMLGEVQFLLRGKEQDDRKERAAGPAR